MKDNREAVPNQRWTTSTSMRLLRWRWTVKRSPFIHSILHFAEYRQRIKNFILRFYLVSYFPSGFFPFARIRTALLCCAPLNGAVLGCLFHSCQLPTVLLNYDWSNDLAKMLVHDFLPTFNSFIPSSFRCRRCLFVLESSSCFDVERIIK